MSEKLYICNNCGRIEDRRCVCGDDFIQWEIEYSDEALLDWAKTLAAGGKVPVAIFNDFEDCVMITPDGQLHKNAVHEDALEYHLVAEGLHLIENLREMVPLREANDFGSGVELQLDGQPILMVLDCEDDDEYLVVVFSNRDKMPDVYPGDYEIEVIRK